LTLDVDDKAQATGVAFELGVVESLLGGKGAEALEGGMGRVVRHWETSAYMMEWGIGPGAVAERPPAAGTNNRRV
jgi:hypothetical protein